MKRPPIRCLSWRMTGPGFPRPCALCQLKGHDCHLDQLAGLDPTVARDPELDGRTQQRLTDMAAREGLGE